MYQQVRKIKPTRRSISGVYPFRGEVSIPFESSLERDFIILQEANPRVSRIVAQPVELSYRNSQNRAYRYTPDFLVYRDNCFPHDSDHQWKPMLVEVKPLEELRKSFSKLKPKFQSAFAFARSEGFLFHVFDERRIRTTKLENLNFLNRYKRFPFDQYDTEELELLLSRVEVLGQCTIDNLVTSLYKSDKMKLQTLAQVWHLISVSTLACDLSLPLNWQTEVWINEYE
ncbi:MAG: TnsA endonuclease N terminal [Idiomarinaceae bacterium HL-53]|nr:MAG: TnsA endonuclease N terminal [Idiomarinaceae bacterium HL-53]CUS47637.1 TnsA endonuclease C terminal [Idiomarinaceae bacterium HL-53]